MDFKSFLNSLFYSSDLVIFMSIFGVYVSIALIITLIIYTPRLKGFFSSFEGINGTFYSPAASMFALLAAFMGSNVHVHLVHHIRKGESEHDRPNKFDLKGSGAIADLADQIFIVWRNKRREGHFQNPNRKSDSDIENQAGASLAVVKNRRVGIEKSYALWFHPASRQFCPSSEAKPLDLTMGDL